MSKTYKTQQRPGLEYTTLKWWNHHTRVKNKNTENDEIGIVIMRKMRFENKQIEILKVKNLVIKIKKWSNGLNNKLDTVEELIWINLKKSSRAH